MFPSEDEVYPFIYIPSEESFGRVVDLGAYGSMVNYSVSGIDYTVFMDNEDFVFVDDLFGYEDETQ